MVKAPRGSTIATKHQQFIGYKVLQTNTHTHKVLFTHAKIPILNAQHSLRIMQMFQREYWLSYGYSIANIWVHTHTRQCLHADIVARTVLLTHVYIQRQDNANALVQFGLQTNKSTILLARMGHGSCACMGGREFTRQKYYLLKSPQPVTGTPHGGRFGWAVLGLWRT